jgi:hypothetical protein
LHKNAKPDYTNPWGLHKNTAKRGSNMTRRLFLMLLVCAVLPLSPVAAQEIYKWEDQNGVVHYSDTPNAPTAAPLDTADIPYSHPGNLPVHSEAEQTHHFEKNLRETDSLRQPRRSQGLPSLSHLRASLATNGHLRLSGRLRMRGKSVCDGLAVEVTIIDELGNVDGNFTTAARAEAIVGGEETDFAGEYLTPVGGTFTWEAVPLCSTADGPVYGAHQHGVMKTTSGRIVRAKTLRRR